MITSCHRWGSISREGRRLAQGHRIIQVRANSQYRIFSPSSHFLYCLSRLQGNDTAWPWYSTGRTASLSPNLPKWNLLHCKDRGGEEVPGGRGSGDPSKHQGGSPTSELPPPHVLVCVCICGTDLAKQVTMTLGNKRRSFLGPESSICTPLPP